MPDYTEEDVLNNEIKRIKKIGEENLELALWRSYLIKNDELRKQMGDRARKLYEEKYDWKIMKKKLLNLYSVL